MGYSIGLQSFRDKKISPIPRSVVWDIFGAKCVSTPEGWGLMYGHTPGGVLRLDDDELVNSFSVRRPSDSAVRDMYSVAQRIPCAISNNADFYVIDESIITGMPDWLLNALPKSPTVVRSADELLLRLSGR
jgi:hypothetical protein